MCPACNGNGVLTDNPSVLRCEECGGLFSQVSEPITLDEVRRYVDYTRMCQDAMEGQFYFDFFVLLPNDVVERIHGWACSKTKRVVQWG